MSTPAVPGSRGQQASRRRNGDAGAPSLADLRSGAPAHPGPARSRVQQQQQPTQQGAASSADSGSPAKSLRTRLMPLAAAGPPAAEQTPPAAAASTGAAPPRAGGFSAQLFSVFTNPLSSHGQPASAENNNSSSRSRAAASIQAAAGSPEPQQAGQQQLQPEHAAAAAQQSSAPGQSAAAAADPQSLMASAAASSGAGQLGSASCCKTAAGKVSEQQDGLQRTYHFEVQAEQLVDYNGHDQHAGPEQQQQLMFGPDGQLQALGGSIQQYVYDEDTGQLCRTGEGAETTRLGRHYLEDCHTGEFFKLAQQPTSGWWAWIRRRPGHLGADGWFQRAGGVGGGAADRQQEPAGLLHSLSEFLDTMGSAMAALALFSQGLAGGLALLCLFMTYIQYATAGREGFLAFYSPQAEMINRTFFTLISISLVAAAARHAYDQLGNFCPRRLRLGLVDSCVMLLYFLAYTCNLLATPLDDQLASAAHKDPRFYTSPLPGALESRLGLWHALNLVRVVTCGLAWVLVCYRSNHFVMLRVFAARQEEQGHEEQQQGYRAGAGAQGAAGGPADASRRLARMGSNVGGSFANRASAGGVGGAAASQRQWAVPSKRPGAASAGGGVSAGPHPGPGVGSFPGSAWGLDQQ